MARPQIPSTENLLGLAAHSLRLVQAIRDHLPVTQQNGFAPLWESSTGTFAYSNAFWIAKEALGCYEHANAEMGGCMRGWPVLTVYPAWQRTTGALEAVLDHFGWRTITNKTALQILVVGDSPNGDKDTSTARDYQPAVHYVRLPASGPSPIPAQLLQHLEHFANILHREVAAALIVEELAPNCAAKPTRGKPGAPRSNDFFVEYVEQQKALHPKWKLARIFNGFRKKHPEHKICGAKDYYEACRQAWKRRLSAPARNQGT
jgi:hypothetical protein